MTDVDTQIDPETRRDRRRLVAMAGMLLVTLLVAVGYGRMVDRNAERLLTENYLGVGDFTVRLPAGWTVAEKSQDSLTVASPDQQTDLRITSFRVESNATALDLLRQAAQIQTSLGDVDVEIEILEPPRSTLVADEEGVVATFGYTVSQSWLGSLRGGDILLFRTIVAGLVDGRAVIVLIDRPLEYDAGDEKLARAVARYAVLQ